MWRDYKFETRVGTRAPTLVTSTPYGQGQLMHQPSRVLNTLQQPAVTPTLSTGVTMVKTARAAVATAAVATAQQLSNVSTAVTHPPPFDVTAVTRPPPFDVTAVTRPPPFDVTAVTRPPPFDVTAVTRPPPFDVTYVSPQPVYHATAVSQPPYNATAVSQPPYHATADLQPPHATASMPPPPPRATATSQPPPGGNFRNDSLTFDAAKVLTRVKIPIFSGDKRNYESWKSAFLACVDNTTATPEYKLLRLLNSLQGEPLKIIESLGHSAATYSIAKERLERKYENMLSSYQRWIYERNLPPSVQTLRVFINQEAEFAISASETVKGIFKQNERQTRGKTFAIQAESKEKSVFKPRCPMCKGPHGLWSCDAFCALSVHDRWNKAKEHKACLRCLSTSHRGDKCLRSRTCGLDGCKYPHHRLLHESKTTTSAHVIDNIKSTEEQKPPDMNNNHNSENPRTHTSLTMSSESDGHDLVVLRTVAVNLVSCNKSVRVNALLDDCSTSTYINGDVTVHLGLEGTPDHLMSTCWMAARHHWIVQ